MTAQSEDNSMPARPSFSIDGEVVGGWVLYGIVGLTGFFLMLPTLIVIPVSFNEGSYLKFPPDSFSLRWYREYFSDPEWLAATWFSFKLAVVSTLASVAIGTMAAIALTRGNFFGKQLIQATAMMPLIVPHIVLAVAFYLVLAPLGLLGTLFGFTLANVVLSIPFVVITVSAALQRIDPDLELAALSCGASRAQAFVHVVLPNVASGVLSGGIFAFLTALDEATIAFFLSDIGNKTLTKKLFEDIDYSLTPVIAAASTILICISLVLMAFAEALRKRNAEG